MEPKPQQDLYRSNRIYQVPIEKIVPNPHQPRQHFEDGPLRDLAESIRTHGILQPLTVQKNGGSYILVAGERRLRAAGMAGLQRVPCILVRSDSRDSALLALVENIQRQDLHYLEEAEAVAALIEEQGLSQEEAAHRLGRSQSALANKLRLLRLSDGCRDLLRQYGLTERHARALLRLHREEDRLAALREMGEKSLTVAAGEKYIQDLLRKRQQQPPRRQPIYIIKDVRLFLNSLERGMDIIRRAGIDAQYQKEDRGESICITLEIPKRKGERT